MTARYGMQSSLKKANQADGHCGPETLCAIMKNMANSTLMCITLELKHCRFYAAGLRTLALYGKAELQTSHSSID